MAAAATGVCCGSVRIPGYSELEPIGRGGAATVLAARRDADGVRVAIKRYHGEDPRAARELEALRRIGAPVAPAVLGQGRADDAPYLVLELIEGESLRASMEAGIEPLAAVALIEATASALARVHAASVVHRDLKPEHVVRRADGGMTILDFGLARLVDLDPHTPPDPTDFTMTRTGTRMGTSRYMPPEQARGERAGPAADVYSLAVIAFELLTGEPPFGGGEAEVRAAHITRRPPAASGRAPLPAGVDRVLERGLAKDPAERFGGRATDLAAALRAALEAGDPITVSAPARSEGRAQRPVGLVAGRCTASVVELDRALAQGESVARATAEVVIVAVVAETPGAAVRAACRTAARLGASGLVSDAVVDVAVAQVSWRSGRQRVRLGAEVAGPVASERAPLLTAAAGAALAPGATEAAEQAEYLVLTGLMDSAPPPLVGRDALVETLWQATDGVSLVLGEGGEGATRIVLEVGERLAAAGRDVVWLLEPGAALAALIARAGDAPRVGALAAGLARLDAVLVVDDLHRTDPLVIAAVEMAASAGVRVLATASTRFVADYPAWAADAPRTDHRLGPLVHADARRLAHLLLAPAAYVPDAVIDRLIDDAGGNPQLLVELVRALRAAGGVRPQYGDSGVFVASDEILRGSAPVADRLAQALLAPLPSDLRHFAVLCACAGDPIDRAAIDAVQRAIGGDWIDPSVGLARLIDAGMLLGEPPRFRLPAVRRAVEASARDEAETVYRALLAHLAPGGTLPAEESRLAWIARCAAGAGEALLAGRAQARLGDAAAAKHRYVEADLAYSDALEHLPPGRERALVLGARAEVRYRIQRFADALADLAAARSLVEDEPAEQARLLLREATVRDWMLDLDGSAAAAERAAVLARGEPRLAAAVACARGRTAYRREHLDEAIEQLTAAAETAPDDATRIEALLLLAPSLLYADRLDESEPRYAEVVALCDAVGDPFHASAALVNRDFLWMRRGQPDRSRADLERAIELARSLGNPMIERAARHNLAETLHWLGEAEAALPHAQRSRALQRVSTATHEYPDDTLLVARVLVALERFEEALSELGSITAPRADQPPSIRVLSALVELAAGRASERAWREAARLLDDVDVVDIALEVRLEAARAALRRGEPGSARQWVDEAEGEVGRSSTWAPRIDALRRTLA